MSDTAFRRRVLAAYNQNLSKAHAAHAREWRQRITGGWSRFMWDRKQVCEIISGSEALAMGYAMTARMLMGIEP
jgi:hypothetical protein